jgi:molybdate transport system permease protein
MTMSVMSLSVARSIGEDVFCRCQPAARADRITLGASPLKIFFLVTISLAWKGIVAGALLAFSRALGEFGATILPGREHPGRDSDTVAGDLQFRSAG